MSTRGRYAQRIKWNPDDADHDYPLRPNNGEELVDFIDRWIKAATLPNGYIHPDDVADLLCVLPSSEEWLDEELQTWGAAVLTPDEVTRLKMQWGVDIDALKDGMK